MFRLCCFILICGCSSVLNAQIISQFTFDSDPITSADVGPDATSVSSSAFSDAGGVGGTNGLNAGLPKLNVNMVIPTDATFDTPGIDVSFDYHREESGGTFWERGSSLRIIGCANLSVTYRVDDGGGGFNTVSSGNVYAIPNDDVYRRYRFFYTDCDGIGVLTVDGVSVWTDDGPDNRSMYWTGAGNVTVGNGIDATGSNQTFFDNLVVGAIGCSPLPIELSSFTATISEENRSVDLNWTTASETNNDFFEVERSKFGFEWEFVGKVEAEGNSTIAIDYFAVDLSPLEGDSYYRLKQVDENKEFTISPSVKVSNLISTDIYPNPAKNGQTIAVNCSSFKNKELRFDIFSLQGELIYSIVKSTSNNQTTFISLPTFLSEGMYILSCEEFRQKLLIE